MTALASVWIGAAMVLLAAAMFFWRPLFSDRLVPLALYGSVLAMTLAGLVLWSHRKESDPVPAVAARRTQAKVAIVLAAAAVAIVYALVGGAARVSR